MQAEFRIHRYGRLNDTIAWFLWCLDVPIEKTLKACHETRRKLKQRTKTRYDEEHTALYSKEGSHAYLKLHHSYKVRGVTNRKLG